MAQNPSSTTLHRSCGAMAAHMLLLEQNPAFRVNQMRLEGATEKRRAVATLKKPKLVTIKTVVNVVTVQYAKAFPGIRINAVEPGFTKTDLNGNTGHQTVEQGAEIIVRMARVGPGGPTGGYFDAEGTLPW